MKALARWIVQKSIPDYQNKNNVEVRARYGALEAWISIFTNLVLFAIKLAVGLAINSVAVIADSVHTLSDTASSIVILIGFKLSKRPPDPEHPYGHQRAESVTALIVAVLLIVAGVELLHNAAARILDPSVAITHISWILVAVLAATVLVKEVIARFASELARMIGSKALQADYWHHRSDALSTLLVLVAIIAARFGYANVDGIAGIAVALIVMYSGYVVGRDAISPLLGESPSHELLRQIENTAHDVAGVRGVHDVLVHRYGRMTFVSLHVEVLANQTAVQLHELSERVEAAIHRRIGAWTVVHADPLNADHPRYEETYQAVMEDVVQDERIANFHDLRILGPQDRLIAAFNIVLEENVPPDQIAAIKTSLQTRLARRLPDVRSAIKVETHHTCPSSPKPRS